MADRSNWMRSDVAEVDKATPNLRSLIDVAHPRKPVCKNKMWALLLVLCFFPAHFPASGQEEPCSLNSTQIFNPACEALLLDYPEVIYYSQSFELSYTCCAVLQSVAVFSITNANAFCGADDYADGSTCSHAVIDASSPIVYSTITCSGGPPAPDVENSTLILTLQNVTQIMSCNVRVPVKWGQSKFQFLLTCACMHKVLQYFVVRFARIYAKIEQSK